MHSSHSPTDSWASDKSSMPRLAARQTSICCAITDIVSVPRPAAISAPPHRAAVISRIIAPGSSTRLRNRLLKLL